MGNINVKLTGGEAGIRTLGPFITTSHFRDARFKPLSHLANFDAICNAGPPGRPPPLHVMALSKAFHALLIESCALIDFQALYRN
ncbi:formate dehydrogenase [Novimethylophilus kurashikiensis]|uniref:Formate dehydrogenase n=1 Tax=Novimethylophilus kurashikiensis TaxID=1825523 RepID=A0A2R5F7W4_9PROT|nr:formate dehydrogenase [Novimethylophilus kurashikiensis]